MLLPANWMLRNYVWRARARLLCGGRSAAIRSRVIAAKTALLDPVKCKRTTRPRTGVREWCFSLWPFRHHSCNAAITKASLAHKTAAERCAGFALVPTTSSSLRERRGTAGSTQCVRLRTLARGLSVHAQCVLPAQRYMQRNSFIS
jgi:hypothetical protein